MRTKLFPFALALALSTGCHKQVAQAAGNGAAPFATPPVLAGTPDVATLVARVKPAVVNITTTHEMRAPRMNFEMPFGFGMAPFGGRGPHDGEEGGRTVKQQALGSGFLIDAQGHVVTNAHVVENADTVRVKLSDDREFEAKVKGRDERLDLAVLELQGAKDLPSVSLGSSDALRVGEYVVAIGNPFGLGDTVTMGIVSAKSRTIGAGPDDDFIQTDAAINPGNSGGPLFNLNGQVIGINTAINPQGRGIGFAIPVDAVRDVLPQLLSSGHVARGRLGVAIQPVNVELAKALGLDHPHGALVGDVEKSGPAERAGLHGGDVIVSVDGQDVPHGTDLPRLVARHPPGSKVTVGVLRDGKPMSFEVTLDQLTEDQRKDASGEVDPDHGAASPSGGLGLGVSDAEGGGVLVQRVMPGGAAEGQLEPGDVVVEVNHAAVARASELASRVQASAPGKPILLRVKREGHLRYVAIEKR